MKRISLVLDILNYNNLIIKYNLNYETSSLIYSWLEDEFPELHDDKDNKGFCYSDIITPNSKNITHGISISTPKAYLNISSLHEDHILAIERKLNNNPGKIYDVDNIKFRVLKIYNDNHVDFSDNMDFWTLSPVCVSFIANEEVSLLNTPEIFINSLKKNIINKYNITSKLDINIDMKSIKRKKVTYKDGHILSFLFNFNIKGDVEIIKKIYYNGLGIKNSIGFGMIRKIK
jgi:CRISPR-associated endoribonuclease Cas6